jgi:hypothetical protein
VRRGFPLAFEAAAGNRSAPAARSRGEAADFRGIIPQPPRQPPRWVSGDELYRGRSDVDGEIFLSGKLVKKAGQETRAGEPGIESWKSEV